MFLLKCINRQCSECKENCELKPETVVSPYNHSDQMIKSLTLNYLFCMYSPTLLKLRCYTRCKIKNNY